MNRSLTAREKIIFPLVLIAVIVLGTLIYLLIPSVRGIMSLEDMLIENITALLLLMSALLGAVGMFGANSRHSRIIFATISLIGLVGFLDEVSFGNRIFQFSTPVVGGARLDGVHDLLLLLALIVNRLPLIVLFGGGVVALGIAIFLWIRYRRSIRKFVAKTYQAIPVYLFVAIAFFFIASVMDLDLVDIKILFIIEELFELNGALALLFCCFTVPWNSHKLASPVL